MHPLAKVSLTVLLFAAPFAYAQPFVAPPDSGSTPLSTVKFNASLRTRMYVWNWFEPAGAYENRYAYSGDLLRLNFALKRGAFDADVDIAVPILLGLPDNANPPAPQGGLGTGANSYAATGNRRYAAMAFPKQLWGRYRFGPKETHSLRAGRFEFNDASELPPTDKTLAYLKRERVSQRLIGIVGFSETGRSFDGLHYSFDLPAANVTVIGATPTRGVNQTDGWGWNRVGFGYASFNKDWRRGRHAADTRIFAIDYDDFRPVLKVDNRNASTRGADTENVHLQTWGAHTIHTLATSKGTLDAIGWVALQAGRWGAQAHRAYAIDFEGGFQPSILPRVKPWVRAGYSAGSGDGDPTDTTHNTFFQILNTPRLHARFPFYNMMNMQETFGSVILRPGSKVTITSTFHSLRLSNRNDLWYTGSGVFQPWTFGFAGRAASGRRSLGNLYDTSAEYQVNKQTSLTAYFGYAQGLSVIRQIYPAGPRGQFGYVEALFRM